MNKRMIELIAVLVAVFASAWLLPGCGELKNKGEVPENAAPVCSLVNTPTDSAVFARNEPIYWYASDRDGFIVRYKYAVVKTEDLPVDESTMLPDYDAFIAASRAADFDYDYWDFNIPTDDPPTETGQSTSELVRLYADKECETCRIEQAFFVVAQDNFGAWSNVPYRIFFRTNHPPDTEIETRASALFGPHYAGTCIEGLGQVSSGISVSWSGSDVLDYPGRQPDFEYEWKVFGPFDSIIGYNEDEFDDDSVDYSNYTSEEDLVLSSCDADPQGCWTTRTFATLTDLFRNLDFPDQTIVGYFVFQVTTQDDAFVPDPTPAHGVFKAIQPACERKILLIDFTRWGAQPASLWGDCTPCGSFGGELREYYQNYMKQIVRDAAGYEVDFYYRPYGSPTLWFPPDKDYICRYKLVILMDEEIYSGLVPSWLFRLTEYMDIGGKVMMFGPDLFFEYVSINEPGRTVQNFGVQRGVMPYFYFNVQAQYCPNWVYNWFNDLPTNEELISASALEPDIPSVLHVDWDHVDEYIISFSKFNIWRGQDPWPYIGVPGVNSFQSGGQAEGLYLANSAKGNFGNLGGEVIAYRYQTRLADVTWFKSAVFGFRAYSIQEADIVTLLSDMINWFDID
jgi:hypothetical protein